MSFRSIPKVALQRQVPADLARRVDLRAADERKKGNQLVTELLCIGLGIDPATYGIAPDGAEASPAAN